MERKLSSEHIRFSPDILRRLGEELIPHVDQGVIELVRNAYDADATECTIELLHTETPGGALRIADNGTGMDEEAIRNGWLVLGRSGKAGRELTKKLARVPVGDKGLGRLSALRLGSQAVMTTRPEHQRHTEYEVVFDWPRFDDARTVESIPIDIRRGTTTKEPGTTIEVSNLRLALGRAEVRELARSLILLADPFENKEGFYPRLIAPSFDDIAALVKDSYFGYAEYKLSAELHPDGYAEARVVDAFGKELFNTEKLGRRQYETAPAKFDLWVFILSAKYSTRPIPLKEARDWLAVVGGVHLYHRGLRVHPYGDPGHDWLDMNLARQRDPELRPGTNTALGRILVDDPQEILTQKTDRSGFIENTAFAELRSFAIDAMDWMADSRVRARDKRRRKEKAESPARTAQAKQEVAKVLETVPTDLRPTIEKAVFDLEQAHSRESEALKEEVQLYRTLATVGTTTAVFAHESGQPVNRIEKAAKQMDEMARSEPALFTRDDLGDLAQLLLRAVSSLKRFAGLPIQLLKRDKRESGLVDVTAVTQDVCSWFEPILDNSKIMLQVQIASDRPSLVFGSVATVEAILTNLFTNARYALLYAKPKPERSVVAVRCDVSGGNVIIRFLDSGLGIMGIPVEDIWIPGKTTKQGGTGLGLTIVKDAVSDLGGTVTVVCPGELGGAEFMISIPMKEEHR